MALSTGIFHEDFVQVHQAVVKTSFLGRVLIERIGERGQWNPELGDYEGGGMIQLYLGAARVQKVARPTRRENVQDSADMQVIRVQIVMADNEITPPADFEWHDNDRVLIVDGGESTTMLGIPLYLHGWVGSTNEWLTNLTCRHNTKQGKVDVGP